MNLKVKKPLGLFLCGGGALGSWQSGVLAGLVKGGLKFDVVSGFSAGALNGAAYCYGRTRELRSIWRSVNRDWVFELRPKYHDMPLNLYRNQPAGLLSDAGAFLRDRAVRMSLFSGRPIYDFLTGWLGGEPGEFREQARFYPISHAVELRQPFISVFDSSGGTEGPLALYDALAASCAIPMVFPPVKVCHHGRSMHLVDGGVIGVSTISLNLFEGCSSVIMVSNTRHDDMSFRSTGRLAYFENRARRMLAMHDERIYDSRHLMRDGTEVHLISPLERLSLGLLEFSGEKCERAYDTGEIAAEEFIRGLS